MRRHPTKPFDEIVKSVVEQPTTHKHRRLPPGRHGDLLVTRDQKRWMLVAEPIEPAVANHLVAAGACLAHDPCGCGGACGLELLDLAIVRDLPKVGVPSISTDPRHPGSISHWSAEDDPRLALVLASGRVAWGRSLA
jgi:hypothetical protein